MKQRRTAVLKCYCQLETGGQLKVDTIRIVTKKGKKYDVLWF